MVFLQRQIWQGAVGAAVGVVVAVAVVVVVGAGAGAGMLLTTTTGVSISFLPTVVSRSFLLTIVPGPDPACEVVSGWLPEQGFSSVGLQLLVEPLDSFLVDPPLSSPKFASEQPHMTKIAELHNRWIFIAHLLINRSAQNDPNFKKN
jgi:hypothetical protein